MAKLIQQCANFRMELLPNTALDELLEEGVREACSRSLGEDVFDPINDSLPHVYVGLSGQEIGEEGPVFRGQPLAQQFYAYRLNCGILSLFEQDSAPFRLRFFLKKATCCRCPNEVGLSSSREECERAVM